MIKKIIFCCFFILCLSGCGEEHRFMKLCRKSDGPATPCKCIYNGISKHIKDMKHYNDWLTVYIKLDETPNLSTRNEAKRLQSSMGTELWDQYIGLLTRYTMMCGMLGVEDADKVMEEIKVLEGAPEKRENNSSKNHYSPQPYSPKILSKLVLDISKPIYEKNENISLLAQWTGADVDCKILEEKVKETLDNRHFEIVDNSISCAGNDNKSLIQLRVQFKSPRIGKLNIPAITLDNNISSNSIDFSVRDLEALQNAVVSKNIESIKAFLSSPADLDAIKIDGEHPVAHFIKDDMAFAQELIKLGASPDVIDKNGYTPLMYAVIRQDNEFLDLLLDKKSYLNELDKKGRTAIMYAAIKNNIYAAKKLVEHKADIYKSKDGKWTAYQYAKEMKHTEIANLLKSPLNEILIIFDGCSSCEKKIKSLEKIVKQQYPSMNISYIRYTPQDSSNKYDHFPDQNYPIIKLKRQKDSDDFGSNSGNILGNWDGTEKQLEKIMYKGAVK